MKGKRMNGFLCRSHASTAVCVPGTARSMVVPRRPDRTLVVDRSRLADLNLKYARLVESSRYSATVAVAGEKRLAIATLPKPSVMIKKDKSAPVTAAAVFSAPVRRHPLPSKAIALPPTITNGDVFQVVVMRVSLHCQGCAGKVKKHISKMEGVTSFSIDLESKRVTVMGHISPAGVLESVSKVKKAEFWHS